MTNPIYNLRAFWSEEDDAFVAVSPEYPGLSGLGESEEQARTEFEIALGLALEI